MIAAQLTDIAMLRPLLCRKEPLPDKLPAGIRVFSLQRLHQKHPSIILLQICLENPLHRCYLRHKHWQNRLGQRNGPGGTVPWALRIQWGTTQHLKAGLYYFYKKIVAKYRRDEEA